MMHCQAEHPTRPVSMSSDFPGALLLAKPGLDSQALGEWLCRGWDLPGAD